MNRPYPVDPVLLAIAIAYRNEKLIADEVMPRVDVGGETFKYLKHTLADSFTIPDTHVGRKSAPNEVDFSATEVEASCEDYGLDDLVPNSDINNAPDNYDPLGRAVEGLTDLVLLDREKRVADMTFGASNYATDNKTTLSGTSQWSDFTNSNPITAIMTALDTMVIRPNVMVLGRAVFTKMILHPKVVKALHGNEGDSGIATRKFLADLLELDDVVVGEGFYNTAKPGQTATLARVWGKHCALIHRNKMATTKRGTTWGLTAQHGGWVAWQKPEDEKGLRGGVRVRSGETVKELITANDLGYLFVDAVA